jgi:bifunctional polynucleotide phosphatase/kinase
MPWTLTGGAYVFETKVVSGRPYALFDMDGTLITTKSGDKHPRHANDWKYVNNKIVPKLVKLNESHNVMIITNQNGCQRNKGLYADIAKKCKQIMKDLGFEIIVCAAVKRDDYRKPNTLFYDNIVASWGKEPAFYVGDAAGRQGHPATEDEPRKLPDHSNSDLMFAKNCNIPFFTPEEYFN